MKRYLQLLLFIFCAGTFSVNAQENDGLEQVIQEFLFSDVVYVQENKELQQTAYGFHTEMDDQISNGLGYEIEYGITDAFQLGAGYNYEHFNTNGIPYNVGSLEIETMIALLNTPLQAATLSFEVEFPVDTPDGDDLDIEDEPEYTPALLYARKLGAFQVHLNVGAEIQQEEVNWFYNAAAVYGPGNWHPVVEVNVLTEEETEWFAGAGLVVNGDKGWEFGTGISHGLDESQWLFRLHLVYEFNLGGTEE